MRARRQTAVWWCGIGLGVLVLLAVGWPGGPASATSPVRDCPQVLPGAPSSHPDFQLNSMMSGWKEDPSSGGMILTLTCWYGTSTSAPTLAVSVAFVERLPRGMQRLEGTCGPPAGPGRHSQTRQVKASWSGSQLGLGAPLAEQLIASMEGLAVTCQQAVPLVACDEWDVRLQEDRQIDWRGNWKRTPGASGYTAIWERLAHEPGRGTPMPTGEFIPRALFVKPGDALQFVSEDPGGVVITYYSSRPFGDPPGEVRGDYEMSVPNGPVLSGSWGARCVDPWPVPANVDAAPARRAPAAAAVRSATSGQAAPAGAHQDSPAGCGPYATPGPPVRASAGRPIAQKASATAAPQYA